MKHTLITLLAALACCTLTAQKPATDVSQLVISKQQPVSKTDTTTRKAIVEYLNSIDKMPSKKVTAHPSAEIFPGKVSPQAPRITRKVTVSHAPIADSIAHIVENLYYSERYNDIMYSTGLYLAPGEVLTVKVPESLAGRGIGVQIGCHTDRLNFWEANKSDWLRLPILTMKKELAKRTTTIASPVGGLVYITCSPNGEAFEGTFTIEGAVASPRFILSQTTDEEWEQALAETGAPWGEIESGSLIISLPIEQLRGLKKPNDKIAMWDEIVGACYDLAQIATPFYRKQRIVPDVQLYVGFLHSGYPIMATYATACERLCDPYLLVSHPESGWGFFHEIGHNMQNAVDWVFAGSTEVSVNLFTLYVFDKVMMGRHNAHPCITPAYTRNTVEKYFREGADFEKWKSDPFLGLITLRQIQEDFGWEIFKKTFRRFQQLDKQMYGKQLQETQEQAEKRRLEDFVVYLSDAAQRDFVPFFRIWGFPISDDAAGKTSIYQEWIPYNFPPVKPEAK